MRKKCLVQIHAVIMAMHTTQLHSNSPINNYVSCTQVYILITKACEQFSFVINHLSNIHCICQLLHFVLTNECFEQYPRNCYYLKQFQTLLIKTPHHSLKSLEYLVIKIVVLKQMLSQCKVSSSYLTQSHGKS